MALAIICLLLGTFVKIVPVLYPTVSIFAGIGMITPPVCVGIYTSASVIQENPAKECREAPIFVGVGILYGILMILVSEASTWLPFLPTI
ncbi:hypothetical protein N9315_05110 [Alphaproteobacteria bacterium]|nr:hypothetical protein [Alphaproteobacteria bacterium]